MNYTSSLTSLSHFHTFESFLAPLFINCHSETASVAHHPFDVTSWFEWLFLFRFSHPTDKDTKGSVHHDKSSEWENNGNFWSPLLEARTDVTHRSAKWESKVNADHQCPHKTEDRVAQTSQYVKKRKVRFRTTVRGWKDWMETTLGKQCTQMSGCQGSGTSSCADYSGALGCSWT